MELGARQGDGASLRTHLQRHAANTGRVDERLLVPPIHPAMRELWDAYLAMSASRRTGMGLHPLTLADIDAWARLNGVRLTPWEFDTLIHLDAACLTVIAKHHKD